MTLPNPPEFDELRTSTWRTISTLVDDGTVPAPLEVSMYAHRTDTDLVDFCGNWSFCILIKMVNGDIEGVTRWGTVLGIGPAVEAPHLVDVNRGQSTWRAYGAQFDKPVWLGWNIIEVACIKTLDTITPAGELL